jgi:anti-anti-sigma factor
MPATRPFVVDLRHLEFMGCCAFAVLARQAERCKRRGVTLCLVSDKPLVARIVAVCGLRPLLPIYPTVEMAMTRATALAGDLLRRPGFG